MSQLVVEKECAGKSTKMGQKEMKESEVVLLEKDKKGDGPTEELACEKRDDVIENGKRSG